MKEKDTQKDLFSNMNAVGYLAKTEFSLDEWDVELQRRLVKGDMSDCISHCYSLVKAKEINKQIIEKLECILISKVLESYHYCDLQIIIGICYSKCKDKNRALVCYKKALTEGGGDIESKYRIAEELMKIGHYSLALEVAEIVIRNDHLKLYTMDAIGLQKNIYNKIIDKLVRRNAFGYSYFLGDGILRIVLEEDEKFMYLQQVCYVSEILGIEIGKDFLIFYNKDYDFIFDKNGTRGFVSRRREITIMELLETYSDVEESNFLKQLLEEDNITRYYYNLDKYFIVELMPVLHLQEGTEICAIRYEDNYCYDGYIFEKGMYGVYIKTECLGYVRLKE